ncbi:MAG: response regulator [Zetaproteobacteria bacterium]|nr:response regulator [Zetaproteobacteria bacterium]
MTKKTLRDNVVALQKQKICKANVVSLQDIRNLRILKSKCRLLVVEDDDVMRQALHRILTGAGYQVDCVSDGLELASALDQVKPDAIILDIGLPWVDGIELCTLIRASKKQLSHVPIVFLSASADEVEIAASFEAGGSDFVAKPFDINFLIQTIEKNLAIPPQKG